MEKLWHVCKLVFVLSHEQSYVERGFSVNKELIDTNMKEKSLVAQRFIYDKLLSEDSKFYDFVITVTLRKSCMLASKCYKDDLEKQKGEGTNVETSHKRKSMVDELETVKRKKRETEQIVKELRKSFETELLIADEKRDDVAPSEAVAFLEAAMQKEKVLEDLTIAQSKIEMNLKTMALERCIKVTSKTPSVKLIILCF